MLADLGLPAAATSRALTADLSVAYNGTEKVLRKIDPSPRSRLDLARPRQERQNLYRLSSNEPAATDLPTAAGGHLGAARVSAVVDAHNVGSENPKRDAADDEVYDLLVRVRATPSGVRLAGTDHADLAAPHPPTKVDASAARSSRSETSRHGS